VPTATCVDGWKSPSIGRQGACSHHGGVKDYGRDYLLIAGGLSVAVGCYISGYLSRYSWATRPILTGALQRLTRRPTPKPAFASEIEIISNAIKNGSKIEFLYKKPNDAVYTKRTCRPIELVRLSGRDGKKTLCVRGYCELREDARTFALKRMKNLRSL
jgi:hypothetical protein